MIIDTATLTPSENYHLMTQTVIPRPIAWVLTQNNDETSHNLAPFSYFSVVASKPPIVMLSFAAKEQNDIKDSFKNILKQRRFVIHIPSEKQLQAVQDSAKPLPYGQSEIEMTKLELCNFEKTGLQRLSQSPIALACHLYQCQTIGIDANQYLVFAEVTHLYVCDQAITIDGKKIRIDAKVIKPLARLGLGQFADLNNILKAQRN